MVGPRAETASPGRPPADVEFMQTGSTPAGWACEAAQWRAWRRSGVPQL
jgi:hypothetical protein